MLALLMLVGNVQQRIAPKLYLVFPEFHTCSHLERAISLGTCLL